MNWATMKKIGEVLMDPDESRRRKRASKVRDLTATYVGLSREEYEEACKKERDEDKTK